MSSRVVIDSGGVISLAALRRLGDQKVNFLMLERDGTVLLTTAPVRPSDARLRRAQALAHFIRCCVANREGTDPPKACRAGASRTKQVA